MTKADVFALGCTLFEAASGRALPKNGPEWHELRHGHVPRLERYSTEFNELLARMLHPDKAMRPSISAILQDPLIAEPTEEAQDVRRLKQELREAQKRNVALNRWVWLGAKKWIGP